MEIRVKILLGIFFFFNLDDNGRQSENKPWDKVFQTVVDDHLLYMLQYEVYHWRKKLIYTK